MPDYQQALDNLDNPPARTPEPTVSEDETLSGSMVDESGGQVVTVPREREEQEEQQTPVEQANYILSMSEEELKRRVYEMKHAELQQRTPPTTQNIWDAQRDAALSFAAGGYRQWIAWAEQEILKEEERLLEPASALEALAYGDPEDDDVAWMHWGPGFKEEEFDIFAANAVSETERNLGPEAADEQATMFQERRSEWIEQPEWMLLDNSHQEFLVGVAQEVHDSVWSQSQRYAPPTGTMKRVVDVALGVAGMRPVLPEEGGVGGLTGTFVEATLMATAILSGFNLKRVTSAFDDLASAGRIRTALAPAAKAPIAYFSKFTLPVELADQASRLASDLSPAGSAIHMPDGVYFTQGQGEYLYGRRGYSRPTGPREGFVPFLYSDFSGWQAPYLTKMRSVDVQRSRDLWREVDGVGSHMTYYTPFPGDVDEQSLNFSREKVWDYVESLRAEAESEEIFINELVDLDRALQARATSFERKANEEMALISGIEMAISSVNPRADSNWLVSAIQSFVPNETRQDFINANSQDLYGPEGSRVDRNSMDMFISIARESPETLEEAKDEHAVYAMSAHSMQEVQRMLGAYLSHYQTGGTGRFDQHVGSYHLVETPSGFSLEYSSVMNAAMQAPGAGFHDGWVAPGQRSIASDWAYDTGAEMAGSVEDERVENVEGAPRFVAEAYMNGRNARRSLQLPLAQMQMDARSSGNGQYGDVASLIYTKFQNDYLPTFQNDYWQYDSEEGGNEVARLGYSKAPPDRMRPWQRADQRRVPESESWGMVIRVNEDIVEIQNEAAKLSPTERKTIADALKNSLAMAEFKRDSLNTAVAVNYSGVTRSLSEMYRNAYGSDAQTLRVLLKAVEGTR